MTPIRLLTVKALAVWFVLVAITISPLFFMAASGSTPKAFAQAPGCSARTGMTLRGNARLRVYSAEDSEEVRRVYLCRNDAGKVRLLGLSSAIVGRPIALSDIWAAAVEERGKPQDEILRDVVARNANDGARNLCQIGLANRPGQLTTVTSLVVTNAGDIGWAGREKLGMAQAVVGTCRKGSSEIVARGSGLDLNSLALTGTTLTWSNEGHQESLVLN